MSTDWEQLASELGSLHRDGAESAGDRFSEIALERILGNEWATSAVDHIMAFRPGSELAISCLRHICSWEASHYAFSLYHSLTGEQADRAVSIIKQIAHPFSIEWVESLLKDKNVAHWGIGLLDQLVSRGRAIDSQRVEKLLIEASALYDGALISQVEFIRSNLADSSC